MELLAGLFISEWNESVWVCWNPSEHAWEFKWKWNIFPGRSSLWKSKNNSHNFLTFIFFYSLKFPWLSFEKSLFWNCPAFTLTSILAFNHCTLDKVHKWNVQNPKKVKFNRQKSKSVSLKSNFLKKKIKKKRVRTYKFL